MIRLTVGSGGGTSRQALNKMANRNNRRKDLFIVTYTRMRAPPPPR